MYTNTASRRLILAATLGLAGFLGNGVARAAEDPKPADADAESERVSAKPEEAAETAPGNAGLVAYRARHVLSVGIELSTLKFFGEVPVGPAFGSRIFGVYYLAKDLAVSGGVALWALGGNYDGSAYGYSKNSPNSNQLSVPIQGHKHLLAVDIEGRYYFVGNMQKEDTPWGMYGLIGAKIAQLSDRREYDTSRYTISERESDSGAGFAIDAGLGAQYNLGPILLEAWGGFALPANQVNDSEVEITFPAFAFAHAGVERRF